MKDNHWIKRVADQVERNAANKKGPEAEIICASGISPSGVIHLGNLREIITVHLVQEELLRRGKKAVHLHFWDDYDRFRKVPANVPAEFGQYIGKPLSEIPDPFGGHSSYAEHFMEEFKDSLAKMGINPTYIRQSEVYRNGTYNELIKESLDKRFQIFDVLSQYQTEEQQKNREEQRPKYYPFKVYCESCGKDSTEMTGYDAATSLISYTCKACGHSGAYRLDEKVQGKLVWKVDWPMRWKHYQVDFEPGGLDHSTPGSSYTVGKQIVKEVFRADTPFYAGYAFVGITGGAQKISSSAGTDATPANALSILEPAMLRWLYIRADIKSNFNINFDDQVFRIYDEWDRLKQRVAEGKANDLEAFIFDACTRLHSGVVAYSSLAVPFRLLAATHEITQGNYDEIYRILHHHIEGLPSKEELLPQILLRLQCAEAWVQKFIPDEERIVVREQFDSEAFASYDPLIREGIALLAAEFEASWTLEGLTSLMYSIPKRQKNFPLDSKPTDEIKQLQHAFFIALYRLILGKETGPRLPTLFLSVGKERLKTLIAPIAG